MHKATVSTVQCSSLSVHMSVCFIVVYTQTDSPGFSTSDVVSVHFDPLLRGLIYFVYYQHPLLLFAAGWNCSCFTNHHQFLHCSWFHSQTCFSSSLLCRSHTVLV